MARRKGWDQLSAGYRERLSRGGISRSDYEAGASLKSARGHRTPAGIGEKSYAALYRQARENPFFHTVGGKPRAYTAAETREVIDTALARGASRAEIQDLLRQRNSNVRAYRRGDRRPGKATFDTRQQSLPAELYWYH